jgi:hypothetical protein
MKSLFVILLVVLAVAITDEAFAQPLLRYSFDESAAGNADALDLGTGTPAAGTLNGLASRTSQTPGGTSIGALDLTANNANNNFVATAADADKIDALSAMTLTMWINLQGNPQLGDTLLSDRALAFPIPPAGTGGWEWKIDGTSPTASNFSVRFATTSSNGSIGSESSQGAQHSFHADHLWLFLALTFDQANGNRVTFFKGSETDPAAQVGIVGLLNNPITNNLNAFRVGKSGSSLSSDTTPPAWIDDVRVYGNVLSLEQLNAVRLEALVPEPHSCILAVSGLLLVIGRCVRHPWLGQ